MQAEAVAIGVRANLLADAARRDARIGEDDEMARVVRRVLVRADKNYAAGHGGGAITYVAVVRRPIWDIRDPADAVLLMVPF